MKIIKPLVWMLPALGMVCAVGVFTLAGKRNVIAETVAEPGNEIVVTIGAADRSALAPGDTLRKQYKFKEAIVEYRKALDTQGLPVAVKAEAEYNIGLSHTWLGEYDQAVAVFNRMLDGYKDDPNAVGYAQYCLAWVEVQKGKYREAVSRLEKSFQNGAISDTELKASTLFQMGRIHLKYLQESTLAGNCFARIRADFPETKAARHPFVTNEE